MKTTLLCRIGLVLGIMIFITTKVHAFTAVASGNWSSAATWGGVAPGSTVTNQDIIIPIGITVNLDQNVTFAGLLNTFTVDGTLSNASAFGVTMDQGAFAGNGTVTINSISFTSLFATLPFTGNLNVNEFRNSGAALTLTAVAAIADSLELEAGSLSIGTGGNVTPQAGSTIKVDNGSIAISGGVFNSGNSYNVLYVGTAKSTGVELNSTTLLNVYLQMDSNTETVTTSGDLRVNGTLYMNRGTMNFAGDELTLVGNLVMVAGTRFESDGASNLTIQSAAALTSGFVFNTGSSLNDFIVDHAGSGNVKLHSALSVNGSLRLMDGNFSLESGATLTMAGNSTVHIEDGYMAVNGGSFVGTASYDVEYAGLNNSTGPEISGSGLTDLRLMLSTGSSQIVMTSDVTVNGEFDMANGHWNLNGNDLTLNGTFDQAATASFVGNTNSHLIMSLATTSNDVITFDNSNQLLNRLTLDLPAGSTLMLGSALTVVAELAMTSGKLDIGNHDLIIQSAAAITNADDVNYIVTSGTGRLQMHVNSASTYVIYPIGTAVSYSPAAVQQTAAGTSGNIMVRAINGLYAAGTTGTNFAATESVVDRTWLIESAVGMTVNMNLRLAWTTAAEVNGFDRTQSYISHYMNGNWDAYAVASATAGANNTYELTRTGITSLSPFGVADNSVVLSMPEELADAEGFAAYPNPVHSLLYVAFPDASKGYAYEVADLTGKTLLRGSGQSDVCTLDVSSLANGCYLLKATQVNGEQATVKRFIKD
jgi:hypothetical protein